MIAIHIEKVKKIQDRYYHEIEQQRKNALKKLEEFRRTSKIQFCKAEKSYLDLIINVLKEKDILFSPPKDIEYFKEIIGFVPENSRKKGQKPLKQFIIDKLGYKGLRGTFYPKYFSDLGIKVCVYCNATLAVSTQRMELNTRVYKSNFDVDHYHSKDDYPFLSIFLFNLYPACASCNRKKGKSDKIKFDLYSDDPIKIQKSKFRFNLDSSSKARFLLTKDKEDLHFNFYSNNSGFQEVFGIQQIYDTQKDLIEELITKSQMYDFHARKILQNSFSKLKMHPDLYLRTLVGTYIQEKDIHKRPMTKFIQDIARDLGIID